MSKGLVGVNSKCGVQNKRRCESHESCVCIVGFPACGVSEEERSVRDGVWTCSSSYSGVCWAVVDMIRLWLQWCFGVVDMFRL